MTHRLLIVEDDPTLRALLVDSFGAHYDVSAAADGQAAERLLFSRHFDLVLLDLMLPGRTGLELLRGLREHGLATPVLVLTARDEEYDRVLGLELGADDYVTKPFSERELHARVKALLRRTAPRGDVASNHAREAFRIGDADVDLAAFEVRRAGETFPLSPKEAAMLGLLHARAGKVVSRNEFLDAVWGDTDMVSHRNVDTHVLNLRRKLERDPAHPVHLQTVHGAGYRLVL